MKKEINNSWFYSNVHPFFKLLQVFIKGDSLVVIPVLFMLLFFGLINIRLMILAFLVFFTLRQVGEMMYWIMRQFSTPTYRPYDFGLIKLDNNAVYILYQLCSIAGATFGMTLIIYMLFF